MTPQLTSPALRAAASRAQTLVLPFVPVTPTIVSDRVGKPARNAAMCATKGRGCSYTTMGISLWALRAMIN